MYAVYYIRILYFYMVMILDIYYYNAQKEFLEVHYISLNIQSTNNKRFFNKLYCREKMLYYDLINEKDGVDYGEMKDMVRTAKDISKQC